MVRAIDYFFHLSCHVLMAQSFESSRVISRRTPLLYLQNKKSGLHMMKLNIPCWERSNRPCNQDNKGGMYQREQERYNPRNRSLSQSSLFTSRIDSIDSGKRKHIQTRTISMVLLLTQWTRPLSALAESATIKSSVTTVHSLKLALNLSTTTLLKKLST